MTTTSLSIDNTTYQDDFETLQNKRILLQDGTTTNPSLSFVTDENTGLLRSNEDTLAFTTGGTTRLSITTTMITNAIPQSFVPGTVTDPGLATTTDSRTGLWSPVPGLLGFSSAGNNRMAIADQVITFVPIYMSDGTATDPSMSFNVDSNTGIYRPTADQIGITTGGTARVTVSNATAAVLPTTASTTTTSGALTVAGGLGVAGNINMGGTFGSATQPFYSVAGANPTVNITTTSGVGAAVTGTFWGAATIRGTGITYSNGVYTVTNAGVYLAFASANWASAGGTGRKNFTIEASTGQSSNAQSPSVVNTLVTSATGMFVLPAGGTVFTSVFQDTGGNINFTSSPTTSCFSIYRLC